MIINASEITHTAANAYTQAVDTHTDTLCIILYLLLIYNKAINTKYAQSVSQCVCVRGSCVCIRSRVCVISLSSLVAVWKIMREA